MSKMAVLPLQVERLFCLQGIIWRAGA